MNLNDLTRGSGSVPHSSKALMGKGTDPIFSKPIDFLSSSERKELYEIKKMIDKCTNRVQILVLERNLDFLLLKSIIRYKKTQVK